MPKADPSPEQIYRALFAVYGPVKCFLHHGNALQLLVATMLSAQCTDRTVNSVTESLFRKYPSAKAFAEADRTELENAVRPCGYYRAKAEHIVGACRKILSDFGGEVPAEMEKLVSLPGVGRKTANVVLGDFFGVPGFPVDTHVIRLSNRIGLCRTEDPAEIERILCAKTPPECWAQFSHQLILHGRSRCTARKPDCGACEIKDLCKKKGVTGK